MHAGVERCDVTGVASMFALCIFSLYLFIWWARAFQPGWIDMLPGIYQALGSVRIIRLPLLVSYIVMVLLLRSSVDSD